MNSRVVRVNSRERLCIYFMSLYTQIPSCSVSCPSGKHISRTTHDLQRSPYGYLFFAVSLQRSNSSARPYFSDLNPPVLRKCPPPT